MNAAPKIMFFVIQSAEDFFAVVGFISRIKRLISYNLKEFIEVFKFSGL